MEYEGLSEIEQEVLAEYAKLATNVSLLALKTRNLAHLPCLRALENKIGLVLTLVRLF